MKIGQRLLCRKKGSEYAFTKKYVLDYLPSEGMVSLGNSIHDEPVYYHNSDNFEFKKLKDKEKQ